MISKRGVLGISQIFLLLIGIIAVAWAVGSEVGVVGGQETPDEGGRGSGTVSIGGKEITYTERKI